MWKRLHVKYPLFLSEFNETWNFSTVFRKEKKKSNVSNLIKICPVGADVSCADRVTDGHDVANSRLRNFANAPKTRSEWFFWPLLHDSFFFIDQMKKVREDGRVVGAGGSLKQTDPSENEALV
jgi:hypothetical protein